MAFDSAWLRPAARNTARPPLAARPIGKIGVALATFLAIVGPWGYARYQESQRLWNAPLPDDVADQRCAIWFIGSSSIYRWTTLSHDLRPWNAHNRGIGGALIPAIAHHFAQERDGASPTAIVFYAGENDIHGGASANDALSAFRLWLDEKTRLYGPVPTYVVSLKPSPARGADRPAQLRFNAGARGLAAARGDLTYIDIADRLLVGGRPGPFFVEDGVHLNGEGYRVWAKGIADTLNRTLPARVAPACATPAQSA